MKELINAYKKESDTTNTKIVFMAAASGIAQSCLICIISVVAETAYDIGLSFQYLMMYLTAFIIFYIGKRYTLFESISVVEKILNRMRIRISDKLRQTELDFVETIRKEDLNTKYQYNINVISEFVPELVNGFQSLIVVIFCLIYIFLLSGLGFLCTISTLGIAISMYLLHDKTYKMQLKETNALKTSFSQVFNDSIDGFKELKLNQHKSDKHFNKITNYSDRLEQINVSVNKLFAIDLMYSQITFFFCWQLLDFYCPFMVNITVN
ncbi:MAG: putative ATP-binding cassette transporter [Candidatus Magnetoglobus multicellularis str. Araruama]|uniref:Putative ATP-binding cassette transporter n=1 Tax=Candidatus Magnetoglobus multicellularis str. Araruama TaxID=890399 RepID=A0A1V1PFG1_9BACT|nr:MAG: putative ATP-binding cassette transporter [Candidatus Magnetoglobus multicellularis str. Araruama]